MLLGEKNKKKEKLEKIGTLKKGRSRKIKEYKVLNKYKRGEKNLAKALLNLADILLRLGAFVFTGKIRLLLGQWWGEGGGKDLGG
jgi:hypothetical protein